MAKIWYHGGQVRAIDMNALQEAADSGGSGSGTILFEIFVIDTNSQEEARLYRYPPDDPDGELIEISYNDLLSLYNQGVIMYATGYTVTCPVVPFIEDGVVYFNASAHTTKYESSDSEQVTLSGVTIDINVSPDGYSDYNRYEEDTFYVSKYISH